MLLSLSRRVPLLEAQVGLWVLLFSLIAGYLAYVKVKARRGDRSRGNTTLFTGVLAATLLVLIQDSFALGYAKSPSHSGVVANIVVFYLSEAIFFVLLITISTGLSITRTWDAISAKQKAIALALPACYVVFAMSADFVALDLAGAYFFDPVAEDKAGERNRRLVTYYDAATFFELALWFVMWLVIVENVRNERELLKEDTSSRLGGSEGGEADVEGGEAAGVDAPEAASLTRGTDAEGSGLDLASADEYNGRGNGEGEEGLADVPLEKSFASASRQNSDALTNGSGEPGEEQLVRNREETKPKMRMLAGFTVAVALYLAFYVGLLVIVSWFTISDVDKVDLQKVCSFVVRYCFLAGLGWIFRPKSRNRYLLLMEDYDASDAGSPRPTRGVELQSI